MGDNKAEHQGTGYSWHPLISVGEASGTVPIGEELGCGMFKELKHPALWRMPLIPALGRQRQVNHYDLMIYLYFQDSQGCIVRLLKQTNRSTPECIQS